MKRFWLLLLLCTLALLCACEENAEDPDNGAGNQMNAGIDSAAPLSNIENTVAESPQVWLECSDAELFLKANQWKDTAANIDVFMVDISDIGGWSEAELKNAVQFFSKPDRKLAVACNGLVRTFGTESFHNENKSMAYNSVHHSSRGEYEKLKPLLTNGVEISYLIFQNPMTNAMYPVGGTKAAQRFMGMAEAAAQTAEAMRYWRELIPEVQFVLYADFYNYAWKNEPSYVSIYSGNFGAGDFQYELALLIEAMNREALPLYGVMLNHPYDYALGKHESNSTAFDNPLKIDWMTRLCDVEAECEAFGTNFMLIYTSDASGKDGDDRQYFIDVIRYLNQYGEAGGNPDIAVLQRNFSYPLSNVPDSRSFTYTHLAAQTAAQFKYGEEVELSALIVKKAVNAPENITALREWNFNSSTEGWEIANGISSFQAENGYLKMTSNTGDPYIHSPADIQLNTADCDYLYIRYLNVDSMSESMQLFFITEESPQWNEPMSIRFNVEAPALTEEWCEVYIPLKECTEWRGRLRQLRLDPGYTVGEFWLDCIVIYTQNG